MYSVIALIRFSFLPSDNRGFALTKDLPFEEKKNALFSTVRMERRFQIFERVCLPSLVAQPSESFGAVLLASELMPDRYRQRLEELLSPYPNLLPTFESPLPSPYSHAFLRPLRESGPLGDIILTCRLDDDDALSSNFTERTLHYVDPDHVGYCVTFPRGLQAAEIGGEPRFWESSYPLISAGLGYVDRSDSGKTIFDCGHHQKVWERFPTIVDGRSPQYIVTLHDENDSTSRRSYRSRPSWRDRLLRRKVRRHHNDQRNPPETTYSLHEARELFSDRFVSLDLSDWSFL